MQFLYWLHLMQFLYWLQRHLPRKQAIALDTYCYRLAQQYIEDWEPWDFCLQPLSEHEGSTFND